MGEVVNNIICKYCNYKAISLIHLEGHIKGKRIKKGYCHTLCKSEEVINKDRNEIWNSLDKTNLLIQCTLCEKTYTRYDHRCKDHLCKQPNKARLENWKDLREAIWYALSETCDLRFDDQNDSLLKWFEPNFIKPYAIKFSELYFKNNKSSTTKFIKLFVQAFNQYKDQLIKNPNGIEAQHMLNYYCNWAYFEKTGEDEPWTVDNHTLGKLRAKRYNQYPTIIQNAFHYVCNKIMCELQIGHGYGRLIHLYKYDKKPKYTKQIDDNMAEWLKERREKEHEAESWL